MPTPAALVQALVSVPRPTLADAHRAAQRVRMALANTATAHNAQVATGIGRDGQTTTEGDRGESDSAPQDGVQDVAHNTEEWLATAVMLANLHCAAERPEAFDEFVAAAEPVCALVYRGLQHLTPNRTHVLNVGIARIGMGRCGAEQRSRSPANSRRSALAACGTLADNVCAQ